VIAPSLGGLLLQSLGTGAPGLFGALVLVPLAFFIWRKLVVPAAVATPATPCPEVA
jgi:hypothetical protein